MKRDLDACNELAYPFALRKSYDSRLSTTRRCVVPSVRDKKENVLEHSNYILHELIRRLWPLENFANELALLAKFPDKKIKRSRCSRLRNSFSHYTLYGANRFLRNAASILPLSFQFVQKETLAPSTVLIN